MHAKKHLSFSAIRSMIADEFAGIEDGTVERRDRYGIMVKKKKREL